MEFSNQKAFDVIDGEVARLDALLANIKRQYEMITVQIAELRHVRELLVKPAEDPAPRES